MQIARVCCSACGREIATLTCPVVTEDRVAELSNMFICDCQNDKVSITIEDIEE